MADAHSTSTDTDLRVGETYALRQFQLKPNGFLASRHQPEVWTTGENLFTCMCFDGPHAVPTVDGRCGFYAYTEAAKNAPAQESEIVHAVVACYGTLVEGEYGVRAEKARIVAVHLPENADARALDRLNSLYPAVTCFSDYDVMVDEYAIPRSTRSGRDFDTSVLGFKTGLDLLGLTKLLKLSTAQRSMRVLVRGVVVLAALVPPVIMFLGSLWVWGFQYFMPDIAPPPDLPEGMEAPDLYQALASAGRDIINSPAVAIAINTTMWAGLFVGMIPSILFRETHIYRGRMGAVQDWLLPVLAPFIPSAIVVFVSVTAGQFSLHFKPDDALPVLLVSVVCLCLNAWVVRDFNKKP